MQRGGGRKGKGRRGTIHNVVSILSNLITTFSGGAEV